MEIRFRPPHQQGGGTKRRVLAEGIFRPYRAQRRAVDKIQELHSKPSANVGGRDASSQKSGGDAPVAGTSEKGDEGVTSTLRDGASRPRLLRQEVTDEDIAKVVASWTHIPVSRMLEGERQKLLKMEERLPQRVIGQKAAIKAVSDAVRRARSGLQDPNRPIGSFIFLGPTGVGKTETARALAEFLFDDENAMMRIDMSEYMEKFSVQRLIGAPPGYVGYEEGGQLSEAVRRRPYSVVLFDEIEKAHHDVFNVLLQVLDDGRLTDGQGRTVDFKNTIVIMTSNLGSPIIQEYFMDGHTDKAAHQAMEDKVLAELKRHFRPEFLNRVDDVIIFQSLDEEELARIVEIQIGAAGKTARAAKPHAGRGRRREKAAGEGRLRPAIRRAPAQTRRAGAIAESALHETARRRVQAGRQNQSHCRWR